MSANDSAKNEVLGNDYILRMIFSLLDPAVFCGDTVRELESSTRRDLHAAALTCKAFLSPATDLLWRIMGSIIPLLKLIPSFVLGDTNEYTLSDSIIMDGNLQILKLYGTKIRHLYLTNFRDTVKAHVLLRFATMKSSLFPNLQSVIIPSFQKGYTKGSSNIVFLACSESLTRLHVENINQPLEEIVASYLSTLSQKGAPIQDLTLGGYLTANILHLLNPFSGLKSMNLTFHGTVLSFRTFLSWSNLPNLTRLVINKDHATSFVMESQDQSTAFAFKGLRDLILEGLSLDDLSKIARAIMTSKNLTTIRFTYFFFPNIHSSTQASESMLCCLQEIAHLCQSLENLTLQASGNTLAALPQNGLSHLYDCKELKNLILTYGIAMSLNDSIIHNLSRDARWDNIRCLCLPSACDDNNYPTLLSLGIIASRFPRLLKLVLSVDVQSHSYDSLESERQSPRTSHGLKQLILFNELPQSASIMNLQGLLGMKLAIGVSRYIEYLFPCLEKINLVPAQASFQSSVLDNWSNGVIALISEYTKLRKETLSEASLN